MSWPNNIEWNALGEGVVQLGSEKYQLSTINCGTLKIPSGKLVCCDPFAGMDKSNNAYINIPPGEYEVVVTIADVSPELDGSHYREAYASLLIDPVKKEVKRKCLQLSANGESAGEVLLEGEYFGFAVDAGTACFVDAQSLETGMPDSNWYEELFDCDGENSWFKQMDNPKLIRKGIANIKLPVSNNECNLILFHSGWGDGYYPVIGAYDEYDHLIAVHIDFFVVHLPEATENDSQGVSSKKPWWKFW